MVSVVCGVWWSNCNSGEACGGSGAQRCAVGVYGVCLVYPARQLQWLAWSVAVFPRDLRTRTIHGHHLHKGVRKHVLCSFTPLVQVNFPFEVFDAPPKCEVVSTIFCTEGHKGGTCPVLSLWSLHIVTRSLQLLCMNTRGAIQRPLCWSKSGYLSPACQVRFKFVNW